MFIRREHGKYAAKSDLIMHEKVELSTYMEAPVIFAPGQVKQPLPCTVFKQIRLPQLPLLAQIQSYRVCYASMQR